MDRIVRVNFHCRCGLIKAEHFLYPASLSPPVSGDDHQSAVDLEIPRGDTASPALKRSFWLLVLLFKGALISSTLGILLLIFQHNVHVGVGLMVVGVGLFGLLVKRYRQVRAQIRTDRGFEETERE